VRLAITFGRQTYAGWNGVTSWTQAAEANRHSIAIAEGFTYSALWMGYGALLMVIGFWRKSAFFRWQALFLIAATIVKVLFMTSRSSIADIAS